MAQDEFTGANERFPATRWSIIAGVRSEDRAERTRALDTLCEAYWKPVYKYVRLRWNRAAPDAQDLTQGFFAEMLERALDRGGAASSRHVATLFDRANRETGNESVKKQVVHERDRKTGDQAGGHQRSPIIDISANQKDGDASPDHLV